MLRDPLLQIKEIHWRSREVVSIGNSNTGWHSLIVPYASWILYSHIAATGSLFKNKNAFKFLPTAKAVQFVFNQLFATVWHILCEWLLYIYVFVFLPCFAEATIAFALQEKNLWVIQTHFHGFVIVNLCVSVVSKIDWSLAVSSSSAASQWLVRISNCFFWERQIVIKSQNGLGWKGL